MKVIDLLNKIANGEIPEKIKYKETLYSYTKDIDYESENDNFLFDDRICICPEDLNDEVEIIEEPQEHKIPKKITMRADMVGDINNKIENLNINQIAIEDKINEIIDYLEEKNE